MKRICRAKCRRDEKKYENGKMERILELEYGKQNEMNIYNK